MNKKSKQFYNPKSVSKKTRRKKNMFVKSIYSSQHSEPIPWKINKKTFIIFQISHSEQSNECAAAFVTR